MPTSVSDPESKPAAVRTVHLPVLDERVRMADRRIVRRRKHRAMVLAFIWLLMIAHVTHWALTGRSVAPFVLSDAMKTLEIGEINPGFLLFAAALLVTLVCGRFLCGWACHMGALQDLCAWALRKCGVRPRMFRSHLLAYVPMLLAIYMFIWPTFKREALAPLLTWAWPGAAAWLGPVQPFPGWSTRLMTTDLWAGLPMVAVAIPFLLLCGFATVYFLGARGLCRYGCPYGGLFLPVEQLAIGRVVVNPDLCDGCGRCTAACTTGVRVLEETRAFGMVVDRNCMRSLDCIAACPHNALALGISRPAVLKRGEEIPRPRGGYGLSLRAELVIATMFAASFFILRGLYGIVPLLMAVTMAVLAAFILWRAASLRSERDARFVGIQLKRSGRVRPGGAAFVAGACAVLGLLAHSAVVRGAQWWGGVLDGRIHTTREQAFGLDPAGVRPADREAARAALRWYALGSSAVSGGIGLMDTSELELREAWLWLVAGEPERAEHQLRKLITSHPLPDALTAELARVLMLRQQPDAALEALRTGCRDNPDLIESREMLVGMLAQAGAWEEAEAAARAGTGPAAQVLLARVLLSRGDPRAAAAVLDNAIKAGDRSPQTLDLLVNARVMYGDVDGALKALHVLHGLGGDAAVYARERAAALLAATGEPDPVGAWQRRIEAAAE